MKKKLFLLLTTGALFAATVNPLHVTLNDFTGGLNLTDTGYDIKVHETRIAENIIIDQNCLEPVLGASSTTVTYPCTDTIIGLYKFFKSNGERFLIALSSSGVLYATVSKTDWYTLKTGIETDDGPLRAAVITDKIFFVNPSGTDDVFYWSGTLADGSCTECPFIPRGLDIEAHNNMLFVGSTFADPSTVYWSDEGTDPSLETSWDVDINFAIFGNNDGDIVRCMKSFLGDIYFFKDTSMWALYGARPESWERGKVSEYYGAKYKESIQAVGNALVFLSNRGMMAYDGQFTKIDENIRDIFLECNNLIGETFFWSNDSTSKFNEGTLNNVSVENNQITLEDKTKVWSSSNTYDTAFCTTTAGGSSSNFSNTEMAGDDVRLSKVNASTDTTVYLTPRTFKLHRDAVSTYGTLSEYNFDLEFINQLKISDSGATKYTTPAEFIKVIDETSGVPAGRVVVIDNDGAGDKGDYDSTYTFLFDMNVSSGITFCKYKFNAEIEAARGSFRSQFLTTNYGLVTELVLEVRVTVKIRQDNIWVTAGSKTTRLIQEKADYYYGASAGSFGNLYYLTQGKGRNNKIEEQIDFDDTFSGDQIQFVVEWVPVRVDKVQNLRWIIRPQYWYQIELGQDVDHVPEHKSTGTYTTEVADLTAGDGLVRLSTATMVVANDYEVYGTTINFKIRSSTWSATCSGESWTDLNGDLFNGVKIPAALSPCRYVQVLSSFSTTQSSHTPVLQLISIGAISSSGTLITKEFNAGTVYDWKKFITEQTYNNQVSTHIAYAYKSGTDTTTLNADSWHSIASGADIPIFSTGTWVRLKATLMTDDGTENPSVESMTMKWSPEGNPEVAPASAVIEDRYWIGISTGDSETNNVIYVYNRKGAWTMIEGLNPGSFAKYGTKDFMSDADSAKIWELNNGNKFNGSEVAWKYECKNLDFLDLGTGINKKHFENAFVTTTGSGTFNFKYKLNGSTVSNSQFFTLTSVNTKTTLVPIAAGTAVSSFQPTIESTSTIKVHNIGVHFIEEKKIRK